MYHHSNSVAYIGSCSHNRHGNQSDRVNIVATLPYTSVVKNGGALYRLLLGYGARISSKHWEFSQDGILGRRIRLSSSIKSQRNSF